MSGRIALIILGLILLFSAYILYSIYASHPLLNIGLEFFLGLNPLLILSLILSGAGILSLFYGITANTVATLLLLMVFLILGLAILKGWIDIDWLRSIPLQVATATNHFQAV